MGVVELCVQGKADVHGCKMFNRKNGIHYTGVTNDLLRRTYEHRAGLVPGFTKRHQCKTLVWFETHTNIEAAILREKRIKNGCGLGRCG